MSLTQFAMVEELAFLVKDNLPCKHLVLSMEEMLVDYLQDDMSLDGVLELEPMNSYNRLLIHRLADIFGFAHQSIGEGDDRHLILKRCEDTSIPSILVGDMLLDHDECQSTMPSQLLSRQEEASPGLNAERSSTQISLEDREAAYLAARMRIFSTDEGEMEELAGQRPRNNPVVARRMIAHALGQRIKQSDERSNVESTIRYREASSKVKNQAKGRNFTSSLETYPNTDVEFMKSNGRGRVTKSDDPKPLCTERKVPLNLAMEGSTRVAVSCARRRDTNIQSERNLKEEHVGAAKRMFSHALRMHLAKDPVLSNRSQTKETGSKTFG